MKFTRIAPVVLLAAIVVATACRREPRGPLSESVSRGLPPLTTDTTSAEPLQPLPRSVPLDPRVVVLGRSLFHDTRLSHDNTISCASCHDVASGGTDRRTVSVGVHGVIGGINAPTVLNSGFNFRQFWDGRAATLEDQADGPTHNASEMGSSWTEILRKLKLDPEYPAEFRSLYRDGLTTVNVRTAIATYERSLVTPSRFDRFLRGDSAAITARELAGYELFKGYGCVSCHQGVNVGGNMYQVFGVMHDYFAARGNLRPADLGRFAVTKDPRDQRVFKVPSLRNVARTAPYFHDGTAATLPLAVRIMGWYQLGRALTPDEIERLVAFLNTLTGEIPAGATPPAVVAAKQP